MERCTHMRWRPIIVGLLLSIPLAIGIMVAVALADTAGTLPQPTPPDGEQFRSLICRMAVGNAVGENQPMLEIYGAQDASWKTGGAYGLFTGFYSGPRGWSGHGPTLDEAPRYLKDGTQFTNKDSERLRTVTAEFRQRVCENLPTPTPQS